MMKFTKERYIQSIAKKLQLQSPADDRLEAERLVRWSFVARQKLITVMNKTLKSVKEKVEVCLTRSADCPAVNS